MGIPGPGKSRVAAEYVARGYLRLDRDERGGSLREVAEALDDALTSGVQRVVLDNTYLTRAARSYVVEAASRHGLPTRCLWLDTPLAQAQVNLVERLLDRFGSLPSPEELRGLARREPGLLLPTSQMRALRELEPPSTDEKMVEVEQLLFARMPTVHGRIGSFVAAAALKQSGWERALEQADRDAPHLVFDWSPGGTIDVLADCVALVSATVSGPVESALCPHGAGPPSCWCRPRRFRDWCSHSHEPAASTRRVRSSSGPDPQIARWRRHSAPNIVRSELIGLPRVLGEWAPRPPVEDVQVGRDGHERVLRGSASGWPNSPPRSVTTQAQRMVRVPAAPRAEPQGSRGGLRLRPRRRSPRSRSRPRADRGIGPRRSCLPGTEA
jgi:hypothetical protein